MSAVREAAARHWRGEFPGLAGGWGFFDNAGGSLTARPVIERITRYLSETPVQHGASYAVSQAAMQRVGEATADLAGWINARRVSEVVVGPSTTSLFITLAATLGPTLPSGAEIIVTDADHEANITPWLRMADHHGLTVRTWHLDRDSQRLELSDLDALLSDKTAFVAVTHCSNVLGTVTPVRQIADRVHAAGAKLCVDGVAFAPHRRVDVQALDCDFYCLSLYKTFGPHLGLLWGRHEELARLESINHRFIGADEVPYKLQPGGVNYELTYGAGGIVEHLRAVGTGGSDPFDTAFERISNHEMALCAQLLEFLRLKNGVTLWGETEADPEHRCPTVAFTVTGRTSASVPPVTDKAKLAIRYGHFYAPDLVRRLGLPEDDGVIRVSIAHYNTRDEVERLCRVLDGAL